MSKIKFNKEHTPEDLVKLSNKFYKQFYQKIPSWCNPYTNGGGWTFIHDVEKGRDTTFSTELEEISDVSKNSFLRHILQGLACTQAIRMHGFGTQQLQYLHIRGEEYCSVTAKSIKKSKAFIKFIIEELQIDLSTKTMVSSDDQTPVPISFGLFMYCLRSQNFDDLHLFVESIKEHKIEIEIYCENILTRSNIGRYTKDILNLKPKSKFKNNSEYVSSNKILLINISKKLLIPYHFMKSFDFKLTNDSQKECIDLYNKYADGLNNSEYRLPKAIELPIYIVK